MNKGRSLQNIAAELERQITTRKDYVAVQGALEMRMGSSDDGKRDVPVIAGLNGSALEPTKWGHQQIASTLGVPKPYYDRMLEEAPGLLCDNVTTWLEKAPTDKRLVRTLDGKIRGWLSSKYRPLDNYNMAEAVLPTLQEKGCQVMSAELTETRMYIKAILPSLEMTVNTSRQKGDIVQAGIVISNSEVGAGAVRVEPLVFRLVCLNGMIAPDSALRKYHVGKGADVDGVRELLTDETKRIDDQAFWLKVRDVVRGAFNQDLFAALVSRIEDAAQDRITADLPKVIEVVQERLALPQSAGQSIMRNLIEGGDLSRWGLVNAITSTANDEPDYEFATALERAGGKVLELPIQEWDRLAKVEVRA